MNDNDSLVRQQKLNYFQILMRKFGYIFKFSTVSDICHGECVKINL